MKDIILKKKIYFISGTARSGSTILSNILCQNPLLHATETSGCLDVLFGIRNQWNALIEHKAHPSPERLHNVLRAVFEGYYEDIAKPIVVDRSRGWLAYIEFVENILQEKMKIIVPVRPVADILASFEVLHRETSKVRQPPGEVENYFQFQTVKGRCDYWLRNDQVVGISLNRLSDAMRRGYTDRLHFVDFYTLTANPKKVLKGIYDFLDLEYFDHDFDHVEQVTEENDEVHGYVNLHKIRNKVESVKSRAIEVLGKDLVEEIQKRYKI